MVVPKAVQGEGWDGWQLGVSAEEGEVHRRGSSTPAAAVAGKASEATAAVVLLAGVAAVAAAARC